MLTRPPLVGYSRLVVFRTRLLTTKSNNPNDGTPPISNSNSTAAQLALTRLKSLSIATSAHLSSLAGKLNSVTGYGNIELLKAKVVSCEQAIHQSRALASSAKIAWEQASAKRLQSQKEVNDLLHRKSSWGDKDVLRFTELVRLDHVHEQEEVKRKSELVELEKEVEGKFEELMQSILQRYHEEQIWSDKIRSASTYGQLTVLGVNLFVFILAIVVVEPWKRKRLAETFEKRIEELSLETRGLVQSGVGKVVELVEKQEEVLRGLGRASGRGVVEAEGAKEEDEWSSQLDETNLHGGGGRSTLDPTGMAGVELWISWLTSEEQSVIFGTGCALAGVASTLLWQYLVR